MDLRRVQAVPGTATTAAGCNLKLPDQVAKFSSPYSKSRLLSHAARLDPTTSFHLDGVQIIIHIAKASTLLRTRANTAFNWPDTDCEIHPPPRNGGPGKPDAQPHDSHQAVKSSIRAFPASAQSCHLGAGLVGHLLTHGAGLKPQPPAWRT